MSIEGSEPCRGIVSRRNLIGTALAAPLVVAATASPGHAAAAPGAARLFFTPAAQAAAARLLHSGLLSTAWTNLRAAADAALISGPASFRNTSDPDRTWQRHVGWSMSNLAAAFLLGGNTAYRDMAIELAGLAAAYPVWGLDSLDGGDLAASDLLFGMSMVVDWLGAAMDPATLARLVATLRQRGEQMAVYATGIGGLAAYWSQWWEMNHLWNNTMGLLATGLALLPYSPTSGTKFVDIARSRLNQAFAALPPDGATQESPTYWEFTAENVLKFHHLSTDLLGQTPDGPWLRRAASYRAAMALPVEDSTAAQSVVNQADGAAYPWFGPEYQLRRLASLNRDGAAQLLAAELETAGLVYPASPWLNFVWFDPTVAKHDAPVPLAQHFTDLDIVVSRTATLGNRTLVAMRAGAPLGRQAQARHYDHNVGLSHVHQDVNHVTLFAKGHYMLLDDGYASRKLTAQHNTLLVNGAGQSDEGGLWTKSPVWPLPYTQPSLRLVVTGPGLDYWVGQGAAAYPAAAGLKRFDRHVVFIKPNILAVVDDLTVAAEAELTLLWHPGAPIEYKTPQGEFLFRFDATSLRATFVLPDGGAVASGHRAFFVDAGPLTVPEIAVTINAQSAQAGALFAWGLDGSEGQVTLRRSSLTWLITTPSHFVRLVPATRELEVTAR